MATQPTNLPVPSESPRDLKFNAGKIDEFVNSMAQQYIDRFGQAHYTIEGLRWVAQQAIAAFGYITLDSFEDGNTLTLPNQVLRLEATGEYYRWDGEFPKAVPAGSTPASTGGVGPGAWLSVGDATLRNDLLSGGKSTLVGFGDKTVDYQLNMNSTQQTETNPFVPSGNFGDNLPLDSSLQVFKYNDEYYSYKGPIAPGAIVPSNPSSDSNWKKEPVSDYIENYGGGVHVEDQTPAILKAISAGVRHIILPKGELRMSQCDIPDNTQGLSFEGQGANQAYSATTLIKPLNDNQNCLFNSGSNKNGQDSIKFKNIQMDGEWRCNHGILHESGAGWYYEKLTGKRFNTWFIYDGQGLARFRDIYCEATDASDITKRSSGGGVRAYSDSVLDTIEVYGGSVPIRISAGGCRLINIFANGGYDIGSIILEPQDDNTNHINTAMANIYIGETTNTSGTAVPILSIQGNSTRRVHGVQISNAYFVHALTNIDASMTMIRADKAQGLIISSFYASGMGEYSSTTRRTYNFLNATDVTGIALSSGNILGINKNPIVLASGPKMVIDVVEFNDWSTNSDSSVENKAAIRIGGSGTRCRIGDSCSFIASQAAAYAVYAQNEFCVDASIINAEYANSNIMLPTGLPFSYMYKRPGGKITIINTLTP